MSWAVGFGLMSQRRSDDDKNCCRRESRRLRRGVGWRRVGRRRGLELTLMITSRREEREMVYCRDAEKESERSGWV